MNDKTENSRFEQTQMSGEPIFNRPDLTGETLGGVKLSRKIGSGGFGDVYISPDHNICVKVIFSGAFRSRESYKRELNAVKCIASCVRKHCGIIKIIGGGRGNYHSQIDVFAPDRTHDFNMHRKFPMITYDMEWECERKENQTAQAFFYYLMLAADNLDKEPKYCPDTLENRYRFGLLKMMSENEKIQVIGEIIDSLLFLYNLAVENQLIHAIQQEKEIFHIAHGDIKPANIFFVNGHAQLGDMGATLQIDPTGVPLIGTSEFMLTESEQNQLEQKCNGDYFAYSVYSDIYALGKTAEYVMLDHKDDLFFLDSDLTEVIRGLLSFHTFQDVRPCNVVNALAEFREGLGRTSGQQPFYGVQAPKIQLKNLYQFSREWQIVEAESQKCFRVINNDFRWKEYSDRLLAERYPWDQEDKIRRREKALPSWSKNDERPILIYKLEQTREFIVLSHRKSVFLPSEAALRLLQQEIAEGEDLDRDDPYRLF